MTEKQFAIAAEDIRPLTDLPGGAIATDRITVEGHAVAFMYREEPSNRDDSGWCFFSGIDEDYDYVNDPDNLGVYALNTIANFDPTIIPLLTEPAGAAFEREPGTTEWIAVSDFTPPD